jgi:alpha-methylacyl-CoA racemase
MPTSPRASQPISAPARHSAALPRPAKPLQSLKGVRILSLALNLPGPAALMRCRAMGAVCRKLEPVPPVLAWSPQVPASSADPMSQYCPPAYATLHTGVRVTSADLKTTAGQRALHRLLATTDVLLTSFRPSALTKLSLGWPALHQRYPQLSQVAIVGAPGARANEPGHDLTYLAERGLVTGLTLPPTLYADMGGSLMVVEAILQAVLAQKMSTTPAGSYQEVALSDAAGYLALPRQWGLTLPGPNAAVGGGHAGYAVYGCQDGRVAVAALEPHFAAALCRAVGLALPDVSDPSASPAAVSALMFTPAAHSTLARFFKGRTCAQLDALAASHDLPMHTLA